MCVHVYPCGCSYQDHTYNIAIYIYVCACISPWLLISRSHIQYSNIYIYIYIYYTVLLYIYICVHVYPRGCSYQDHTYNIAIYILYTVLLYIYIYMCACISPWLLISRSHIQYSNIYIYTRFVTPIICVLLP